MPFVFEQPNLDNPSESHLYFDPGGSRSLPTSSAAQTPSAHPLTRAALTISPSRSHRLPSRRRYSGSTSAASVTAASRGRGFMDSIYFTDPLGLLIELASYRFEPPAGHTHAEVLMYAHRIRVARGDYRIAPVHLADAIEQLVAGSRESLSDDRAPKDPYGGVATTGEAW
jgi:glyoxalase family protein